jgi:GH15 family glucan-1,4-alpha-glucosidase
MQVSDGGPLIDERYVVDPSFLDLVRLGVKRATIPVITNSVKVVDDQLSYLTANGRFWHRASFDGYGEQADGASGSQRPRLAQDHRPRLAAAGWRARRVRAAARRRSAKAPPAAGHHGQGRRRRQPPDG